jgi:hypothetical protein
MTVCSEVMSYDWPYENGIDFQHIGDFFFLRHKDPVFKVDDERG